MNWDDIKLFLILCRNKRLDLAASAAELDATTLSRRIKRLEKQLSLTLFERTQRGHVLTAAGEELARLAEKMESTALEVAVHGGSETSLSGNIRLGAPEGFGTTVIAPALAGFRKQHPQIRIDLIALSGFVSVPKRQADMSILLTRPTTGKLKVKKLGSYKLFLYSAKKYLRSAPPITSLTDLADHPLIGYTEDLIYSSRLRYLQDLLPGLKPTLCSPSIVAQQNMILAGGGVGILPEFMASRHGSLQKLLPDTIVEREFWLAIHQDIAGLARIRETNAFLSDLDF